MNTPRGIAFHLYFALWTGLIGLTGLPLVILNGMRAPFFIGRWWAGGSLWGLKAICGISHHIEGWEHLPQGPFILASNHQSAWETLAYLRIMPNRPCFIFKKELLWVPVLGFYLKTLGMVAIDRKKGVKALAVLNQEAARVTAEGRPIILFPEGTRVPVGEERPFQRGIVPLCKALALPVIPAAHNAGLFWPRRGFAKHPGVITLRLFPPLPADAPPREIPERLEAIVHPAVRELCGPAAG